jgi:hypothetical protein
VNTVINCEVPQVANNLLNNLVTGVIVMWFQYTFHHFRPTAIQTIVNSHPIIVAVYEY